jgi:putative DNA methylase
MPLASSFILSKKKGREAWVEPATEGKIIHFVVQVGKCPTEKQSYKIGRGAVFKCPVCGEITTDVYVKQKGKDHKLGVQLMTIVAEGPNGRIYISPNNEHELVAHVAKPESYPRGAMPNNPRWFSPPAFGMTDFSDLFTPRQLTALTTFSDLVHEAQKKAEADAVAAGMNDDGIGLDESNHKEQTPPASREPLSKGAFRGGGAGATAYGQAVGVYLGFAVDKIVDRGTTICSWDTGYTKIRNTFARQAIPMTWDYAEGNPFSDSTGCWTSCVEWSVKYLQGSVTRILGNAVQQDAVQIAVKGSMIISTDPPYYDNIGYADLSDFFYVWLRQSLKDTYPNLFGTMLVPKTEELVATPYRFDGSTEKARDFFEKGMLKAFQQVFTYAREDVPVTIYYAFKQSETEEDGDDNSQTASTGWETMLSAIIKAGFAITGTWPMRTEMANRSIGNGTNALASSIVLVCRKRPSDASTCTRRDFINALKRELKPALQKLQASNIAPVDLAQSAIGPGMGVYSRFSKVLEADGTPMSVRSALQIINQELDLYFTEQDGELDRDSRFCVDLYTQYAFNDMKFGEADVLARAKNTSVEKLSARGVLYAQKGVVRLLTREEIPEKIDAEIIWLLAQQLVRALEKDGVSGAAQIMEGIFTSEPEQAKALAYRLFTIAERKGWAAEAYAYNSLVIAWPDVQSKAAELAAQAASGKQTMLFDE